MMKFLKERLRRAKISESKREYHKKHGNSRRVPVREMGSVIGFIYLPIRK